MTGSDFGVRALANVTTVRSSVIHLIGGNGTGISADTQTASTTLNADGVTVGPRLSPMWWGSARRPRSRPPRALRVKLTNSILRGGGKALFAQSAGAGDATVAASYSDYDPSFNTSTGPTQIGEANVSNVGDAGFVASGSGDFRLLPTSKLVDAGDPATAQGVDLAGNPLVADGNGDGIARRDLGAFEVQAAPQRARRHGHGGHRRAGHPKPPRDEGAAALHPERARARDGRHQAGGQARRPRPARTRLPQRHGARVRTPSACRVSRRAARPGRYVA